MSLENVGPFGAMGSRGIMGKIKVRARNPIQTKNGPLENRKLWDHFFTIWEVWGFNPKYISGIISNLKQKLYALYCMPDHVHILVSIKPDCKISDLVRDIKANSSRFINEKHWLKQKFQWQEGYGAFTYSNSQLERVVNYIIHQPDYHKRKTFREEYEEILEQYGVDYKAEYLFEYYE